MSATYTSRLQTKRIWFLQDAAAEFGEIQLDHARKEKRTNMVLMPRRNPCKFWLTIPEGMHALVESHGRFTGIWSPGFHLARPWERVSHLVTKQHVVYDIPVKECPTLDNVMVEIDVSVVFHVKDNEEAVKNFVYRLGPERLEGMLKAYQEEAVRTMARKKTYQHIYDLMETEELDEKTDTDDDDDDDEKQNESETTPLVSGEDGIQMQRIQKEPVLPAGWEKKTNADGRDFYVNHVTKTTQWTPPEGTVSNPAIPGEILSEKAAGINVADHHEQLENTKRSMNEKLDGYGIEVYSITITNVRLPDSFAREMEQATTFVSKNKYAAIEQEYNLTVIQDTEVREQLEQKLFEDREQIDSEYGQKQAQENKLLRSVQAETAKMVAKVEAEKKGEALQVKRDGEYKTAKLGKEAEIARADIVAAAEAEATRLEAERQQYRVVQMAEAELEVARHKAEALALRAEAEKLAAEQLKAKREYDRQMQSLRIIKNLAANKQLAISGNNKDNVVAQLLANNRSGSVLGLNV